MGDEKTMQANFIADFCHAYGVKSESNTEVEMHALTQKFISKADDFEHPLKSKYFMKRKLVLGLCASAAVVSLGFVTIGVKATLIVATTVSAVAVGVAVTK